MAKDSDTAIIAIEQVPDLIERGRRLLGVDLGTKTIGLALSDVEWRIATPLTVIARRKFTPDAMAMAETAQRYGVGCLVFGLPLNMDGSAGPRAQATRAFIRSLRPILPLPVVLWDERLSTAAAERTLIEADLSRAKRAAVIDRAAAAFILQGALDRLRLAAQAAARE
jgi:putative Holliday junction resolvase